MIMNFPLPPFSTLCFFLLACDLPEVRVLIVLGDSWERRAGGREQGSAQRVNLPTTCCLESADLDLSQFR